MKKNQKLNILYIASEAVPLVKVGGLADVAGSLPHALANLTPEDFANKEIDIRLVIPFHSAIRSTLNNIKLVATFDIHHTRGKIPARVFQTNLDDITLYLVEGGFFLSDQNVYSTDLQYDTKKYLFFSLAVLELIKILNWQVDILHTNDWQTALICYELSHRRLSDPFFKNMKSVLTMHNLPYMGGNSEKIMSEFGLSPCPCHSLPEWARSIPLPIGMYSADFLLTVSPNYMKEILTPEFGCGLQDFLISRKDTLGGILNGINQDQWNPKTDQHINTKFDLSNLSDRGNNKEYLQSTWKLTVDHTIPLFVMISRMDQQKGVDIAINSLRMISHLPWQVIILGTGDPVIETRCRSLEVEYPHKVRTIIDFDPELAHKLYAGSDLILIPSRYEPSGLTQMIAMRYGCVPLARATGGLKDSIIDHSNLEVKTGYLFEELSPDVMSATLIRAMTDFKNQEVWQKIQINGMKADFSWTNSARKYALIYNRLTEETG